MSMSSINYEWASSRIDRLAKGITDQNKHVERIDFVCRHGMGGSEATKRILGIDPVTRVIWCSGRIDNPIIKNYREYGVVAFLNKPFNNDDIHEALGKAIDC